MGEEQGHVGGWVRSRGRRMGEEQGRGRMGEAGMPCHPLHLAHHRETPRYDVSEP